MNTLLGTALTRQYGIAIDQLETAIVACPDSLWTQRLWLEPSPPWFPPQFAEFWFVSFHTLVWLDIYLSGIPEDEFAPPPPFPLGEIDSHDVTPDQPYPKDGLLTYLAATRQKCHTLLGALTDEHARRPIEYAWTQGQPISYLELQLYNLRHLQEHAAQLSLFLGQHHLSAADRN